MAASRATTRASDCGTDPVVVPYCCTMHLMYYTKRIIKTHYSLHCSFFNYIIKLFYTIYKSIYYICGCVWINLLYEEMDNPSVYIIIGQFAKNASECSDFAIFVFWKLITVRSDYSRDLTKTKFCCLYEPVFQPTFKSNFLSLILVNDFVL